MRSDSSERNCRVQARLSQRSQKEKKSTSLCPHQPASPALWGSWRLLIKKESCANPQLSRNCPSLQNRGQEGLQCRLATWLSWSLQLGEGAGRETFSNFTAGPRPAHAASPGWLGRWSRGSDSTCGLKGSPAVLGRAVGVQEAPAGGGSGGALGAWHRQGAFLRVWRVLFGQECESTGFLWLRAGEVGLLGLQAGAGTIAWC